jgi:hypothetical protein
MSALDLSDIKLKQASNPDEHEKYLNNVCTELRDFVCHKLSNILIEMLGLQNCPLRTPLQLTPHHAKNAEVYKNTALTGLGAIQDEMKRIQAFLDMTREQLPILPDDEDLSRLTVETNKEQNGNIKHRLQAIIILMSDSQANCNDMWKRLDLMYASIHKTFQDQINQIAVEMMKLHERLIPELTKLIKNRKATEQKLHTEYPKLLQQQVAVRKNFYQKVSNSFAQQVEMMQHMLIILECLINAYSTGTAKDQQLSTLQKFRSGSENLISLIHSEMNMNLSTLPILRSNLLQIQNWINNFQKFFLKLIEQFAAQMKSSGSDGKMMEIPLTNAEKLLPPKPKASTPGGLLVLDPRIVDFYQTAVIAQGNNLAALKQKSQEYKTSLDNMQYRRQMLEKQLEVVLQSPDLHKAYAILSNESKEIAKGLNWQAQASKYQSEQLNLHTQLTELQNAQIKTSEQMQELAPRLQNNFTLVDSLNRIIYICNNIVPALGKNWMKFIEEEQQLCDQLNGMRENYHLAYLNFRNDTRQLLGAIIAQNEAVLQMHVDEKFNTLIKTHLSYVQQTRITANEYRSKIAKNRTSIDLDLNYILNLTRSATSSNSMVLCSEISRLLQQRDKKIQDKTTHNWYDYISCVQNSLVLFTGALGAAITDLFQEEKTGLMSYLQVVDHMCCVDNLVGSAPCPRPTVHSNTPSGTLAWIQLAKFPEHLDATLLLSSPAEREEAQDFEEHQGYKDETEDLQSEQESLKQSIDKLLKSQS